MTSSAQRQVKVVFVGDSGVGKSTLIARLETDVFQADIQSTIGAQFRILGRRMMNGSQVSCWDTAGQERFTHILPIYYRNCDLLVLCFEIGDDATIDWLHKQWHEGAKPAGVKRCLIVGTKSDKMTAQELERYWDVGSQQLRIGAKVHLTSSKSGEGIRPFVEDLYAILEEEKLGGGGGGASKKRGDNDGVVYLTAETAPGKPGGGGCRC